MKRLARLLVVSALACFGLALLVGTARAATVQNQNSSSGGFAASGSARVTNTASVRVGPSATSVTGPAQASQIGSNYVAVNQTGVARSGDAVVGSQITGIVGGGDAVVQNQNASTGGTAITGDASASNTLDAITVGPSAFSVTGPAMAEQLGDNEVVITQSALAESGDAVVNSQVTGIVGGGDSTVQGQNAATDGFATSGAADATNAAFGSAAGPVAGSVVGSGQASQFGDNVADLEQNALSTSGDGVSGSQVVGTVGDVFGFATVRESSAGF